MTILVENPCRRRKIRGGDHVDCLVARRGVCDGGSAIRREIRAGAFVGLLEGCACDFVLLLQRTFCETERGWIVWAWRWIRQGMPSGNGLRIRLR